MPLVRKKKQKKENLERWLLTYADLITLLLAFFVIMYAISTADVKKFGRLAASMQKAFNVGVLQGQTDFTTIDEGGPTLATITQAMSMEAFEYISKELDTYMKQEGMEGLEGKVTVVMRDEGIAIILSDNALFASGQAALGSPAKKLLTKISEMLIKLPNEIRIEGHTDNIPPNNPEFPTNWDLSMARALSVVRFMSEEGMVPAKRLSAAGFAEFHPIVENDSPENRAKNRRCEILILYPK